MHIYRTSFKDITNKKVILKIFKLYSYVFCYKKYTPVQYLISYVDHFIGV